MSQVQNYRCEVCGIQERDHSNWLLVSDQPRAHNLDILKWDEKLAAQPGICHLCCANHLQALVGAWMMPDLGIPTAKAPADDRSDPLNSFNFDRACLSSALETDRESLLAMLDAVEVVLQTSKAEDEEPTPIFDA
jgi:hypothetical protein